MEKLQQVQENQVEGTVCLEGLHILRPRDVYLVDLVKVFTSRRAEALIACVYQSLEKPVKVGTGLKFIRTNSNFFLGQLLG